MRMFRMVLIPMLLVLFIVPLFAQDPAKVGSNVYKCTFENERMRLCEIRFKAGDAIAKHSHPAHLIYAMTAGTLRITGANGTAQDAEFKPGMTVWTAMPDTHSAVNIGKTELRGLVIELKEPPPMTTEQTLLQMESDWGKAMAGGDMAALDAIIAPDWSMTSPDGQRSTRAESMADLRSGALKFESMVPSGIEVKMFGDTAIVTGTSKDKGTYKGQDISGEYRFTDVFVKRDGKWMAVSTHVTRVGSM